MTRYPLQSVIALGMLIASISGAGVVAVFSDTATTGTNSVTSGEEASLEALQIAIATFDQNTGDIACGQYSSDLQTGLFTMTDVHPLNWSEASLCLKNTFTSSLSLSVAALDLADIDIGCSGDEATFDASCGTSQAGSGELSQVLNVSFIHWTSCRHDSGFQQYMRGLDNLPAPPLSLGSVAAAEVACFDVSVLYRGSASSTQQQAAQTDQVSWRFAFTGTE